MKQLRQAQRKQKIILIILIVISVFLFSQSAKAVSIYIPFGGKVTAWIPVGSTILTQLADPVTAPAATTCSTNLALTGYGPTLTLIAIVVGPPNPATILLDTALDTIILYSYKSPMFGNWVLGLYDPFLTFTCPTAGLVTDAHPLVFNSPFLMMGTSLPP